MGTRDGQLSTTANEALSKALVLDFGGVISRTLFETHPLTEHALGLKPGTLKWRGPFDPESDSLWQAMQNNDISERDYWLKRSIETGKLVGKTWLTMEAFVRAARGDYPEEIIRPEFLAMLAQAESKGYRLALLSNELDLFYGAEFKHKLDFMKSFESVVDASYTGILKPDPAAYQLVLDELNLSADRCVFVDDQKKNIDGALALGFKTVHFNVFKPDHSYGLAMELMSALL